MPTADVVRLTVAVSKDDVDTIAEIARRRGVTKTRVLREAIALLAQFEREMELLQAHGTIAWLEKS